MRYSLEYYALDSTTLMYLQILVFLLIIDEIMLEDVSGMLDEEITYETHSYILSFPCLLIDPSNVLINYNDRN